MKRFILPALVVIAIAAVAGYYIYGRLHPANTNTLSVSGNLELTQVDISFKVPGKLIALNVDEGTYVKKGMVIARIDRDQVESQHARDEASLVNSQSQFDQTETAVQLQRHTLESDIALHMAELRASQARLAALVAGSRPQEIQESRASVADAKAQHDQAQADWDRAQDLFKNDDISKQQYDQYRMRLDSTAAVLRQSDERLALVVEGPRHEDIDAARADVVRAQAAVEASRSQPVRIEAARAGRARAPRRCSACPRSNRDYRISRSTTLWLPRPSMAWCWSNRRRSAKCWPPGQPSLPSATSIIPGCAPISTKPIWARKVRRNQRR